VTPRLEVEAIINGRLISGNLRLAVHDLGFGGFSVESPIGFTVGTAHEFRFVMADGTAVAIMAEAVYSRPSGMRDGMDHLLTGFKYVLGNDQADRAVELLLDAAIAPLSFR